MRNVVRSAWCVFVAVVLTGCASPVMPEYNAPISRKVPLDSGARVYVTWARDGFFEGRRYETSGEAAAYQLAEAARTRFAGSDMATGEMPEAESLKMARQLKARYVLSPTILHWEDRATEWSGRPDKIAIEVVARDAGTGEILDLCDMNTECSYFAPAGQQPEALLPGLFAAYLDYLVGRAPLPK